jgi:hypothetical protein
MAVLPSLGLIEKTVVVAPATTQERDVTRILAQARRGRVSARSS